MRLTDAQRLALVRAAHTAIYFVMAASVFAVLYAGVFGTRGVWLWAALALVVIEVLVFAASGMKCPLTEIATKYGARPGADTFMPERFTRHTLHIFGPLIVIGLTLVIARAFGLLA